MGYWIFMSAVTFFLPVFAVIYCTIYRDKVPKYRNGGNGYKTARSKLSEETWEFANRYYNRIMRVAGWILLAVSVAAMLFAFGKSEDTITAYGSTLLVVQTAAFLVAVVPTENALTKMFDEFGYRK